MIYVIDDKVARRERFLRKNQKANGVVFASDEEIRNLKRNLELKDASFASKFSEDNILAIHTSMFENIQDSSAKGFFENALKEKSIPCIFFSGGNVLCNTLIPGFKYSCSDRFFYNRIFTLDSNSNQLQSPDFFLFGNNYRLSRLLHLRRALVVSDGRKKLDVFWGEVVSQCENDSDLDHLLSGWPKMESEVSLEKLEEVVDSAIYNLSEYE